MDLMNYLTVAAIAIAAGLMATFLADKYTGEETKKVSALSIGQQIRLRLKRREERERRSASPAALSGMTAALMNSVVQMVPQSEASRAKQLDALKRTGMKMTANQFWAMQIICIAVGLILGAAVSGSLPGSQGMWALLLGPAIGFALPQVWLVSQRRKWQNEIERELPNCLDLLAISVAAGTTFESAIKTVVRTSEGALPDALSDVVKQSAYMDTMDALKTLAENAGVPSFTIFAASLIQARDQGLPIEDILKQQAETVREMRRMKLEELINKLPVKIIFPIVFFIFPALFGVVLVPAAMRMMQTLAAV